MAVVGARRAPRSLALRWPSFDGRTVAIVVAIVVVAYLTAVPIALLIWSSFKEGHPAVPSPLTLQNYLRAYTTGSTFSLLWNSIIFATGSTLVAITGGTLLAWIVERTNVPLRKLYYGLTLVPILVPGILSTIAWIFLLSPRIGLVNAFLIDFLRLPIGPLNVYSLGGMIFVEGLSLIPLVFIMVAAAFRSMDPALEESALMSGADVFASLRRITIPLLLPAIASAALISFIRAVESFEVPALIGLPVQINVFTSQIYTNLRGYPPQFGLSSSYAVLLLAMGVAGVWAYNRLTAKSQQFATVTGKAYRPRVLDLGRWRIVAALVAPAYLLLSVGLPFGVLLWSSLLPFYGKPSAELLGSLTLANYAAVFDYRAAGKALSNSIVLAFGSATMVMVLTAVVAWITVRTKLPGRFLLDGLAFLPIAVPGIVIGISLIVVYSVIPIPIYGTLWILLVAYVTKYMPFGMRSVSSSMVQIHRELEEAASVSGAGWFQTFGRVLLPLLKPGLIAGWLYIVIISLRELSSSVLLYSGDSIVFSVLVFDLWQDGRYPVLAALSIMLIFGLAALVAVTRWVGGKFGVQEA